MNKKLLLTSMVVFGIGTPALAAPSNSSSTFPADGLMQADYRYLNAAIKDNMAGVYDGTVYANAKYINDTCTVAPGYYLEAGNVNGTACPVGSYCPGGDFTCAVEAGKNTCPYGYTSEQNAPRSSYCYRNCDTSYFGDSSTSHVATVHGKDYYGYGPDTCVIDSCVAGWHLHSVESINLSNTVGDNVGENSAYVNNNGENVYTGSVSSSYFGGIAADRTPGMWWVNYGVYHGLLVGEATINDVNGANSHTSSSPTGQATFDNPGKGNKCWCRAIRYNPYSDSAGPDASSWVNITTNWVFYGPATDLGQCANYCSQWMQQNGNLAFRRAMLSSVSSSGTVEMPARCVVNTITIKWGNTTSASIHANDADTVTYGGDIKTPSAFDASKTPSGKKFLGWQFSTTADPSNTYVQE